MIRKSKLTLIIGSVTIGIISFIAVYLILLMSGVIGAVSNKIVFASESAEFVYDGLPHTNSVWSITQGKLRDGHKATVEVTGVQTSAGSSENFIDVFISDEAGLDVTGEYEITYQTGTLTVSPREITVTVGSAEKDYDGNPLTCDKFEVSSEFSKSLLDGHNISITAGGYRTAIGESDNSLASAKITDSAGADVTSNYKINSVSGKLTVMINGNLEISTAGDRRQYNGLPLTAAGYSINKNTLPAEYTVEVTCNGSITDVGAVDNTIELSVMKNGEDFSKFVHVEYDFGKLEIEPKTVTFSTNTKEWTYDGKDHYDDGHTVTEGSLVSGHLTSTSQVAVIRDVGSKPNTMKVAVITSDGKDVTRNYKITYNVGELRINTDGNDSDISHGGGENPPIPAVKIYSDVTGKAYLRQKSFGNYTGTGWAKGKEYDVLLDGKYSMNYLTGAVLQNAGYTEYEAQIELLASSYVLPYHLAMDSREIQKSDVTYSGDGSKQYALNYYNYDYIKNGEPEVKNLGTYSDAEKTYRDFVKTNYTYVPDGTKAYLNTIIDKENFRSITSRYEQIKAVKEYVQGAAKYSLDFDQNLNNESDKVVAFLRDYKEGICQHFASAATCLFRTLGYSARYVTGFAASTKQGEWNEITYKSLHAWTEIYIDGMGWVDVEVTGGDFDGGSGNEPGDESGESDDTSIYFPSGSEPSKEVALKVKSDITAGLYLKEKTYGNYSGTGWKKAKEYDGLLDGKYSMNYLTGLALKSAGYASHPLEIELVATGYKLPYYMVNDDNQLQTSDTESIGTDTRYSVNFYSYFYGGNKIQNEVNLGKYSDAELNYRQFVYENYLDVPDSTKNYLRTVIDKQGFDRDDPNVITDVQQYIQGAAKYNMSFPAGLNSEKDIVVSFLRDYKEGVCQHYASSATCLFRTLGIPARYATGFAGGIAKAGEWNDITFESAHAWTEIYLDGIGWVQLEVTGPDDSDDDNGDNESDGIKIKPVNEYQLYDASDKSTHTLAHSGILQGLSNYTNLGYTYEATVSGIQNGVGICKTKISSFKLFDKDKNDVTNQFKFNFGEGILQIYEREITVTTQGGSKVYDGTPLTNSVYNWSNNLLPGHRLEYLNVTGEQTAVGNGLNNFDIKIVDSNGADVTATYKITRKLGILKVNPVEITVTAHSDEKIYDGTALMCQEYSISGLDENFEAQVIVEGSQTSVGKSENIISSVIILDKNGNDVTANFKLILVSGNLSVKPKI